MINPLEQFTRVVSDARTAVATVATQGSFTAPEDLTLRQVRLTAGDTSSPSTMIVSLDPDLTTLDGVGPSPDFQLIAVTDPSKTNYPITTIFEDLSFPLLKGQTIYWGGGSLDVFQLIFS